MSALNAVSCWGGNDHGQLGDGTTTDRSSAREVVNGDLGSPIAGGATTWVGGVGPLFGWGEGGDGQFGDGTRDDRLRPTWVMAPLQPGSVGLHHACGLRSSGAEWLCWGRSGWGQLGDGTEAHERCTTDRGATVDCAPTPVATRFPAGQVLFAGADITCATDHGEAWCAGWNASFQLGDGIAHGLCRDDECSRIPVRVAGVTSVSAFASVPGTTCFLSLHHVYCVGSGARGALGDGLATHGACPPGSDADGDCAATPVEVVGLDDAIFLTGGGHSFYAIRTPGDVVAWGANDVGQLGDGTTTDRYAPVAVLPP
jgi:alpha-tubulin suppressor-like RCC1 family protein